MFSRHGYASIDLKAPVIRLLPEVLAGMCDG
jgi:hypothetical protein